LVRLAVLADIHANLPALEAVCQDMEQIGVDQVVIAGDAIGRGPFPLPVLGRIASAGWPTVRGNNELYFLSSSPPLRPKLTCLSHGMDAAAPFRALARCPCRLAR